MVLEQPVRIGNKEYTEVNIKASWSGEYPCLCHGKWTLIINDQDFSELLNGRGEMNTYNYYEEWHFDDNWNEIWTSYEDGLKLHDWIEANKDWLSKITDSIDVQKAIYYEINVSDWRPGSCGGCI